MSAPHFSNNGSAANATDFSDAALPKSEPASARRINPYKMFVGSFIPNWLLKRPEISQGGKLCYARLAQFAGEDGCCFPKQVTLGIELGVAERTVRDYIRELEKSSLIESVQNGLRRANNYYFLDHPWIHAGQPCTLATAGQDQRKSAVLERRKSAAPSIEENQGKENQGKEIHKHTAGDDCSLPNSETEAVVAAKMAGIPEDFARNEFNGRAAVGWVNGAGIPIRSWPHYLAKRWTEEQSQRAERAARPGGGRATSRHSPAPPRQFTPADY